MLYWDGHHYFHGRPLGLVEFESSAIVRFLIVELLCSLGLVEFESSAIFLCLSVESGMMLGLVEFESSAILASSGQRS